MLRGCSETTTTNVPNARAYNRLFASLPVYRSNGGIAYLAVHDTATRVEDALVTWIADLEAAMTGGADCTDEAVTAIRAADASAVEVFNGRYLPADVQAGRTTSGNALRASLAEPQAQTEFATVFGALGMVGNWISPSFWLGSLVDVALDLLAGQGVHNPYEAVGSTLAGDWEAVSRTSDALSHLSDYFSAAGDEVSRAWANVSPDWSGETATAAGAALSRCADSIGEVGSALAKVSSEYNAVAVGIYECADMITSLLREFTDALIVAAIAAAEGTALIETGIGAVAGYSVAAAMIVKVVGTLAEISEWLSTAIDLSNAFISQVLLWLGAAQGVPAVTIDRATF